MNQVNIHDKPFAYIEHKSDLTEQLCFLYKNSLIFIGDEKQIYNPLTNSYVGIGLSSYNTIISNFNKYLPLTGGTMTGDIYFQNGGRIFKTNSNGLGIYSNENIYLRPSSATNTQSGLVIEQDTITFNNYLLAYTGNIVSTDETITDTLTNIAYIAGIPIKAKVNTTIPSEIYTHVIGLSDYSAISYYSYYSDLSYYIDIHTNNTNNTYYINFSKQSGKSYIYADSNLIYNPGTNTLSASLYEGQLDPQYQWGII